MKPKNCFELLDAIRRRPALWLGDHRSIKMIWAFLGGYDVGFAEAAQQTSNSLDGFNDWIAKRHGYSNSTSGWCNMILDKAGSDEKAYYLFFELLDEFRKES